MYLVTESPVLVYSTNINTAATAYGLNAVGTIFDHLWVRALYSYGISHRYTHNLSCERKLLGASQELHDSAVPGAILKP